MKRLFLSFFGLLTLCACQTLEHAGQKQQTADAGTSPLFGPPACPPVKITPDLQEIVEFPDLSNPSPKTEISRLRIRSVQRHCTYKEEELAVRLDISFDGRLGPKARIRETDKPSYAFPYFVAVSGPDGNILAKGLFAASVSYGAEENEISRTDTITQRMPLNEDGSLPDYTILIGFQLAEEQLAYNRAGK